MWVGLFSQQARCPVASAEEDATEEEGPGHAVCGSNDEEDGLSSEDQTDKFLTVMVDDESILVCLAGEDLRAHNGGVPSRPATISSDPPTASCETLTFLGRNTAEKATSTSPRAPTCDVTVSTEPAPCTSAHTQTEAPKTAEQQVITEIYMSDMDYLTEVRRNRTKPSHSLLHQMLITSQCFRNSSSSRCPRS